MTATAPRSADVTARLAAPRSAVAVGLLFAVNGLVIGAYGGALPSIRQRLDLSAGDIAVLLFVSALAAIVAMQVGGRLSDTVGGRRVALTGLALLVLAMVTFGVAGSFAVAVGGAVLLGLGNGTIDVSMNAVGVQVEAARERPIMSLFHALWSVGGLLGAGAVLVLAAVLDRRGAAVVAPLLLTVAAVAAVCLAVTARITPPTALVAPAADGARTPIPPLAWLLAVMAVGFGLAEGTGTDWSSLHVTEVADVDPTTGALGLVAVQGCMVVVRLVGDRLVARFGRRAVVRAGGACAAVGYVLVTLVADLPLLLLGWALVGLGVGMIAPQVYAVAGHLGGGRVLAVVVTFGYAAFLAGPAVMGFVVTHLGMHHAMVVPAVLCVAIVALARTMPADAR